MRMQGKLISIKCTQDTLVNSGSAAAIVTVINKAYGLTESFFLKISIGVRMLFREHKG